MTNKLLFVVLILLYIGCIFLAVFFSRSNDIGCVDKPLTLSLYIENVKFPVYLTSSPLIPNIIFIVGQTGLIYTTSGGEFIVGINPFLDLTGKVNVEKNNGLWCMAFHPIKPLVYLYYADPDTPNMIVSEFQYNPTTKQADPTSEKIYLKIPRTSSTSTGGWLGFSPRNGYLYISTSNGDSLVGGQDLTSFVGKILRIEVDKPTSDTFYTIPDTNPFADHIGPLQEIWSYGLMNPWRCSFDAQGSLYIGNISPTVQELFWQSPTSKGGQNYGWPSKLNDSDEGDSPPLYQYKNNPDETLSAIICGYQNSLEDPYHNWFFFSDKFTDDFFTLKHNGLDLEIVCNKTSDINPPRNIAISSYGEDGNGHIYVCDLNGKVFEIKS